MPPDLRLDTTAPRVKPDAAWLASLPWHVERIEQPAEEAEAPRVPKWQQPKPETAPIASVPLFITQEQKRQLAERGFTAEQIRNMKPEEAHRILGIAPETAAPEAAASIEAAAEPLVQREPGEIEDDPELQQPETPAEAEPAPSATPEPAAAPNWSPPSWSTTGPPSAEPSQSDTGSAAPRGRYVKTADIKHAAGGRGADVLRGIKVSWPPPRGDHVICPLPGHNDHDPSFRWDEQKGCAFCTCDISGSSIFDIVMRVEGLTFEEAKVRVAEILGRTDLIIESGESKGLRLTAVAEAKGLPIEFLQKHGWFDQARYGKYHRPAVGIPYKNREGEQHWIRYRVALLGKKRFFWRKGDVDAPLYGAWESAHLPDAGYVVLVGGETDTLTLWLHNFAALGLPGEGNWNETRHAHLVEGVPTIFVIVEPDEGGKALMCSIARSSIRDRVKLVFMPCEAKDANALYLTDRDGFKAAWQALLDSAEPWDEEKHAPQEAERARKQRGTDYEHFYAYLPDHRYIHTPTGATWPVSSVNAALPWRVGADGEKIAPFIILDRTRPVEQMTWLPGAPSIIRHKYVQEGGWIAHPEATVYNRYKAPIIEPGNPLGAARWRDHVSFLYPDDAEHIVNYLAFKAQFPGVKINHALVLGGDPGTGKDTLLQPMKYAVGSSNFRDITAPQALEPNNDFLQAVILLISEARDGDKKVSPYAFYEHTKVYIAAPPDTLRINEKYIREYNIFNIVAVVITTNNRLNGLYMPGEDRRHYVAWSLIKQGHSRLTPEYFDGFYAYLKEGGARDVTAFLLKHDLSGFNAKAPPHKTDAFWRMVNTNRPSENAELADLLEKLGDPEVVTTSRLTTNADDAFSIWLKDRANQKAIPHRLAECGYASVRNPDAKDGLWKIWDKREAVYAKDALSIRDALAAVRALSR